MIRVMIVDDEYYFRKALAVSINWEELGFEMVGEVSNGKEALENIEVLMPQVILADVNMPVMSGLEFIKSVIKKNIYVKFIIISGHNEFKFAKEALDFGVKNYILKPVNNNELANALNKVKEEILRESSVKLEMDILKKQANENLPLLRNIFLNDLVQGKDYINPEKLRSRAMNLNISVNHKFFRIIIIEAFIEDNEMWNSNDIQLYNFAVINIVEEVFSKSFYNKVFFDSNERICAFIGFDDELADNYAVKVACEQIRDVAREYLKLGVTIGVGNICNDISHIEVSYNEAIYSLKNRLIMGKQSVILYNEINEGSLPESSYNVEQHRQLLMSVRAGELETLKHIINKIFNGFKEKKVQHSLILVACIELISICIECLAEIGKGYRSIFKEDFNPFEYIQTANTLDELEAWILDVFMRTTACINQNNSSKSARTIEDVKAFIKKNIRDENLKISTITENVFINMNYLCFLFKRETGMTINDYITDVRMKKAEELMRSGECSVIGIANRVGFADANYFGKCFKKFFGISPGRYIDQIGSRGNDLNKNP